MKIFNKIFVKYFHNIFLIFNIKTIKLLYTFVHVFVCSSWSTVHIFTSISFTTFKTFIIITVLLNYLRKFHIDQISNFHINMLFFQTKIKIYYD